MEKNNQQPNPSKELNKSSSGFIPEPKTIQDFEHNAKFQFDNVAGWMSAKDYESALIKAHCLISALEKLILYSNANSNQSADFSSNIK